MKQSLNLVGYVCLNLKKVRECIPPNCTVAPQWYMLKNMSGDYVDVMLLMAIFKGYQGDPMWNLNAIKREKLITLTKSRYLFHSKPMLRRG